MIKNQVVGKNIADVLTYFILIVFGLIFSLPFLWMIFSSFKTSSEIWTFPPVFLPDKFQWSNYLKAWQALPFDRFFLNSIIVTVCVTVGQLFTCSLGGYAFARLRFKGRDKIFLTYLATMMIPFPVLMVPLFIIMRYFGWIDTLKALIAPFIFSAWGTFLMRQFMLGIPRSLEDAAKIDGCSYWKIYWQIIIPLCKPVFATLGIFTFMMSWNQFFWPLIMINTIDNKTLPLGLAMFRTRIAAETPWNLIMAAACFIVLPVVVLFIVGQKYYVKGIVTTGMKE